MGIFDDIPDEETPQPASPAGNDAAAENWMMRGTSGRTDPTQLGFPVYYDDLPEMERNKGPKDRSLSVLANQGMLGYLPYARAGAEAQTRGESYFGGTDQYERQRKALQQYYNDAYEASPDAVKVLGGVGLPGGPMAQAGKYLTSAARPIVSGAAMGAGQAGVAGYLAPVDPATGDWQARALSAAKAAPFGALLGGGAGAVGKAAQSLQPQLSTPAELAAFHEKAAETAPAPSPFSENARAAAAIHDRGRLIEDQRGAGPVREAASEVPPEKPGPAGDLFGDIPDEEAPAQGQHLTQDLEGFPRGGSEHDFTQQKDAELARDAMAFRREMERQPRGTDLSTKANAVVEQYKQLGIMDWLPSRDAMDVAMDYGGNPSSQLQEVVSLYGLDKGTTPLTSRLMYKRLAGENESRNVQSRMNMSAEERRATPPWQTQDVPDEQQIIRYGNRPAAEQLQPAEPANQPPDRTQLQRQIVETLNAGQPHEVHPQTVAESHAVIRAHGEEIPAGIQVGTLSRIEPLPDGRSVKFTFQTPQGEVFSDIRPDADLFGSRALFDPRKHIVALFEFGGLGTPDEVQRTLGGGIRHEGVHASRFLGQYTPPEWNLLVNHAENNLQSLDWDLYQWGKLLGRNPSPALRGISLRNQYESAYAGYPEAVRDEYMNEEAVAHMVEGYHHISQLPSNHPLYQRLMPLYRDVEPVLAKMFSGEIAARAPQSGVEAAGQEPAFAVSPEAQPAARNVDPLGYYSQALEAAQGLKQAKGTPEQMLAQLRKGGAKDAEIEAANLRGFLEGKKSITRDEIVKHLEENRVGLNEVTRDLLGDEQKQYGSQGMFGREWADLTPDEQSQVAHEMTKRVHSPETKWQGYSLAPNNPSYRETVLHLPEKTHEVFHAGTGEVITTHASQDEAQARVGELLRRDPVKYGDVDSGPISGSQPSPFTSGHFPEPNITGHLMTSQVKDAAGKPVLLLNQIQSDWGQGVRDKGVKDETKIAGLKASVGEAERAASRETDDLMKELRAKGWPENASPVGWANEHAPELAQRLTDGGSERANLRLLRAELKTAEASVPGHPLVNTTDQWVRTTLRRAIAQAVESGASSIAIPSGDTVLSYNPGNEHGMREFYGKIVPLALKKLMRGQDAAYPEPQRVEKLETPSKGPAGKGFTVFPITDAVRASVARGQPLFARGGAVRRTSIKEAAKRNAWHGDPHARAAMRAQGACAH